MGSRAHPRFVSVMVGGEAGSAGFRLGRLHQDGQTVQAPLEHAGSAALRRTRMRLSQILVVFLVLILAALEARRRSTEMRRRFPGIETFLRRPRRGRGQGDSGPHLREVLDAARRDLLTLATEAERNEASRDVLRSAVTNHGEVLRTTLRESASVATRLGVEYRPSDELRVGIAEFEAFQRRCVERGLLDASEIVHVDAGTRRRLEYE